MTGNSFENKCNNQVLSYLCQLCCITFDDNDEMTEPPYGDNTISGCDDYGITPMPSEINNIDKPNYVLQTIYNSDWPDFKKCQLCCITFDDNDDITEPPYGDNTISGCDDYGITPMPSDTNDVEKPKCVLQTIYKSDWPDFKNYDFFRKIRPKLSDESTVYPESTTTTTESEITDSDAVELCSQLEDINRDLAILSKKLDELADLQKLL
ncbi:hypothetical protein HNY73_020714 [Argiope bruennichi]|uniref:Uncharacterized protein n=1 Tax=Argiope bruennichi TaxID=94029 RepID=A0A8T0E7S2_ARGBR|nr:hypothetical protein HNY73_020714 [Argiope bruennichi]